MFDLELMLNVLTGLGLMILILFAFIIVVALIGGVFSLISGTLKGTKNE